MMYAQINSINRIISLSSIPNDNYILIEDANILHHPQNYKYINNVFVEDIAPSVYHSLNEYGNWFLNEELMANAKKDMWEKIKEYRDYRESMGVLMAINTVNYWFHTDVKSLVKYLFLLFLSTIFSSYFPQVLSWKTMDGRLVPLTTGIIIQIFFTTLNSGSVVFEIARQHKINMEASSDPLSYNFTTGWPPIYEGEL